MTDPEKDVTAEDKRSLAHALEDIFEGSDYVIQKVSRELGLSLREPEYYGGIENVTEHAAEQIVDGGDLKEALEYLSQNYSHSTYDELQEKYFPTSPEGTYEVSIPEIRESKISLNPQIALEPTLHESEYIQILNAIHISGSNIEQKISSFFMQDEGGLRDTILTGLQTAFPTYSASGETFNVEGKTDILLKYNNENIFVAECKIWAGKAEVNPAIDQLMKYLTWRDSKTALILFVKNSSFSSVLTEIPKIIGTHPNHQKFIDEQNGNRFNFEFTLKKDPGKIFKLAVICFNFYHKN